MNVEDADSIFVGSSIKINFCVRCSASREVGMDSKAKVWLSPDLAGKK